MGLAESGGTNRSDRQETTLIRENLAKQRERAEEYQKKKESVPGRELCLKRYGTYTSLRGLLVTKDRKITRAMLRDHIGILTAIVQSITQDFKDALHPEPQLKEIARLREEAEKLLKLAQEKEDRLKKQRSEIHQVVQYKWEKETELAILQALIKKKSLKALERAGQLKTGIMFLLKGWLGEQGLLHYIRTGDLTDLKEWSAAVSSATDKPFREEGTE
jgi:hypothetical protein